jgi:hypothetical protein
MNLEQSANFLTGSILLVLGLVTLCIGIVVINNILHKYWKPVRIFTSDSWNINPPPQCIDRVVGYSYRLMRSTYSNAGCGTIR